MNKFILSLLDTWDVESLRLAVLLLGEKEFFRLNAALQDADLFMRFYREDIDRATTTIGKGKLDRTGDMLILGDNFKVINGERLSWVAFDEEDLKRLKEHEDRSI